MWGNKWEKHPFAFRYPLLQILIQQWCPTDPWKCCFWSPTTSNNTKKTINLQPEFQYQEQYNKQLTCNLSFNIKNTIIQFFLHINSTGISLSQQVSFMNKQLGNTRLHYPHSWSFAEIPWISHHSWEWNHELVESWVIGTHEINKPMKTWPLTHVTARWHLESFLAHPAIRLTLFLAHPAIRLTLFLAHPAIRLTLFLAHPAIRLTLFLAHPAIRLTLFLAHPAIRLTLFLAHPAISLTKETD